MTPSIPSAEQQVVFLQQLQRLLSDGSFVATYKYALLHALADLAVSKGDDSGAELPLRTCEIAEQIIELYWRQAAPFPTSGGGDSVVLQQNTGRQATIITRIQQAQQTFGSSLPRFRRQSDPWQQLVREVDHVLRVMPLWKLQTVGTERVSFLYENLDRGNRISLRAGVAYCLRAFYPLILNLIRGAWVAYVRSYNASALGEASELGAFLFGTGRASLATFRPIFAELQDGTCFYCRRLLRASGEVDHFIPWARYPVDLGHNFVLAHNACNRDKSDHLAAERHLERWLHRNETHATMLGQQFDQGGLPHALSITNRVALWAYGQAAQMRSPVWEEGRSFHLLPDIWETLFNRAMPSTS